MSTAGNSQEPGKGIKLTEEMRRFINNARANGTPCILATASPDGVPNAGFRGSMLVFDDGSLAYRERSQLSSLEHLESNPKVVVLFRDSRQEIGQEIGWKFRCTATVYRDGPINQQVMERLVETGLVLDPEIAGVAVVLRVDQIVSFSGQVLQERVPNLRW